MRSHDRIYVSKYLKDLTSLARNASIYLGLPKEHVVSFTCHELALRCGVIDSTISNLNTSSSYFLLDQVAGTILDVFYGYFSFDEHYVLKEYPDEVNYPRDKNYVLMCLTNYYTGEWFHG